MSYISVYLPLAILFLVSGGYLYTVFEPYLVLESDEARELIEYHASDLKLIRIAEFWAARLSGACFFDPEDEQMLGKRKFILDELARRRFINGDDPGRLVAGPLKLSRILRRSLSKAGFLQHALASELVMSITATLVKCSDGTVVWRGSPAEYRSRFCDFYPEP